MKQIEASEAHKEQELAVEDITLGMANERIFKIESPNQAYDGKVVRIRSLRGSEFRRITNKVKVGRDDLAGNYALAVEACILGILTPGIAAKVNDIDHDVVLQIGEEIISASKPKDEDVEDFSDQKKEA